MLEDCKIESYIQAFIYALVSGIVFKLMQYLFYLFDTFILEI